MTLQKVAFLPVIMALALSSACSRVSTSSDLPLDATVDIEQTDREAVAARRASAGAARDVGSRVVHVEPAHRAVPAAPAYREITIPADTVLEVELKTSLASDESRREDHVGAQTLSVVVIDGEPVVPQGSTLTGAVVEARQGWPGPRPRRRGVPFRQAADARHGESPQNQDRDRETRSGCNQAGRCRQDWRTGGRRRPHRWTPRRQEGQPDRWCRGRWSGNRRGAQHVRRRGAPYCGHAAVGQASRAVDRCRPEPTGGRGIAPPRPSRNVQSPAATAALY